MRIQKTTHWWWVYHYFLLVFSGLNVVKPETGKWELARQRRLQEMPQILTYCMRKWFPKRENMKFTIALSFFLFSLSSCISAPKQPMEAKAGEAMRASKSLQLWGNNLQDNYNIKVENKRTYVGGKVSTFYLKWENSKWYQWNWRSGELENSVTP